MFVAGGIGITPLRAMLHEVLARGHRDATLVYLTRAPEATAYREELLALAADAETAHVAVVLHHSATAGRADLWPWLEHPDDGLHLYACASSGLLDEVRALTMHWRPSRVHVEDFAGVAPLRAGGPAFTAVWAPTGRRVAVPAATTMLDALASAGVDVPRSCESGTCGTCRLSLLAGTVEHRDLVLRPAERDTSVLPCVSRATSPEVTVGPT
nr:iron-sulfur cluster-binding domain-containing protein [Kineococcus siccus]